MFCLVYFLELAGDEQVPIHRSQFAHELNGLVSFSEVDYAKVRSIGGVSQNTGSDAVYKQIWIAGDLKILISFDLKFFQ